MVDGYELLSGSCDFFVPYNRRLGDPLHLGDFNGDSFVDIATVNRARDDVSIIMGFGSSCEDLRLASQDSAIISAAMKRFWFAWWNTGLSPNGKQRQTSPERWEVVKEVIRSLIDDCGICFLSLGEVAERDIPQLLGASAAPLCELYDDSLPGIAIVYRSDMTRSVKQRILTSYYLRNRLRRCLHVELSANNALNLHLFVLHWPSDAYGNDGPLKRARLAEDLRQELDDLDVTAQAIVLGDFNEEPFSSVISQGLEASRSRERARKKRLRYNPCWRQLGEQQSLQAEISGVRLGAGTYYYRQSGAETQWYNFDQILLSSSLLDPQRWHLFEDELSIWCKPPLSNDKTGKPNSKFDHLPVLGCLHPPLTRTSGS